LKNPTDGLARWALELLEYDYTIEHRKEALHHVPDALSRMYESDTEVAVNAILDTVYVEKTSDEWYRKRVCEVIADPKRYAHWKIVDGQLYYFRPKLVISEIVEDLDRWKLVLPQELRLEALREAHDIPQASHLGVEKTY